MQRAENAQRIATTLRKYSCIRVPEVAQHVDHAYYRLYGFIRDNQLQDGWTRDRIIGEVSRQGIPVFWGGCSEIYREQAFKTLGLVPAEPLPVAAALTNSSVAFLVHPTLTAADLDTTCSVLDSVLTKASLSIR